MLMGNIAGEDGPTPQVHQTNELQHIEGRKTRREKGSHPVEKSIQVQSQTHTKNCVEGADERTSWHLVFDFIKFIPK